VEPRNDLGHFDFAHLVLVLGEKIHKYEIVEKGEHFGDQDGLDVERDERAAIDHDEDDEECDKEAYKGLFAQLTRRFLEVVEESTIDSWYENCFKREGKEGE